MTLMFGEDLGLCLVNKQRYPHTLNPLAVNGGEAYRTYLLHIPGISQLENVLVGRLSNCMILHDIDQYARVCVVDEYWPAEDEHALFTLIRYVLTHIHMRLVCFIPPRGDRNNRAHHLSIRY